MSTSRAERAQAARIDGKSRSYVDLHDLRGRADINVDDDAIEGAGRSAGTGANNGFGEAGNEPMSKRRFDPPPVTADRTVWGIAKKSVDGEFRFPYFWSSDRRWIDLARGMFPPELREDTEVIRVHVTVWAFARTAVTAVAPQPPAAPAPAPRKKRARRS